MSEEESLASWLRVEGVRIRQRIRILMLLDAADYAVISPVSVARFHTLAFLADVLSPIYHFVPIKGRILKRRAGPYFPDLQWEVDRLIGLGLVVLFDLRPVLKAKAAPLDAVLSLERQRSAALLDLVNAEPEFQGLRNFFRELAGALSCIDDLDLDAATQSDVTWEAGAKGAIIDYAEWRAKNFSTMSAERIEEVATRAWGTRGAQLSPGAKVNLYVQYMRRAAHG